MSDQPKKPGIDDAGKKRAFWKMVAIPVALVVLVISGGKIKMSMKG